MTIGALCPPPIIRRPHSNVISKYQSLVAAEKLDFDPIQLATVERLQNLQGRLDGYVPAPARSEMGLLGRVSGNMGLLGRVSGNGALRQGIDYVTRIGNLHMRSTGTPCYGYRPSNG